MDGSRQSQEAEMIDVDVVLQADYNGRNAEAYDELQAQGLEIVDKDDDDGVVEGTLPADRLGELKKLSCVAYVRHVFTYLSETPEATAERPDGFVPL